MSASHSLVTTASFHPFAEIFPLLEGPEFDALAADIKARGLQEPIVEYEHAILDGRNRYRACIAMGVEPRFISVHTDDPLAYVISANLLRRHLGETQMGVVAARIATLERGRPPTENAPRGALSQEAAGTSLNVSRRTVQRCKVVLKSGVPELLKQVEAGGLSAATAAKVARLSDNVQRKLVGLKESEMRGALKRLKREEREAGLAESTVAASAILGRTLYPVIYADPPWRFAAYSAATGMDRAADNHYPTMTTDEICAMAPPAGADCVLFLWATAPMLLDALDVMDSWGFEYKSHFCWVKQRAGTGYWNRNRHELLLIGVKGEVPAPAMGEQYESVIAIDASEHSAKPAAFAEMIETMFPSCRLLEMFARGPRLGWDVHGNEASGR